MRDPVKHFLQRNAAVFVLVAIVGVAGMFLHANQTAIERNSTAICRNLAEGRAADRIFVAAYAEPLVIKPGSSLDLVATVTARNQRFARQRDVFLRHFPLIKC